MYVVELWDVEKGAYCRSLIRRLSQAQRVGGYLNPSPVEMKQIKIIWFQLETIVLLLFIRWF